MYGELEGSWARPDLGYAHGGASGGVSDFTSNLRRSKSFRYSMARGLGGREGMGREGEDMMSAAAAAAAGGASTGIFRVSGLLVSPLLCLSSAHRQQQW